MKRHELTDEQWELVEPLIPVSDAKTGRPAKDRRLMLDGIFWILATGAPWRDLPERFGSCKTVHRYFSNWRRGGVFAAIIDALQVKLDKQGLIDWELWCVDGAPASAPPGPRPGLTKKSRPPPRRAGRPRAGPQPRRVWNEVSLGL
jgi:transposase